MLRAAILILLAAVPAVNTADNAPFRPHYVSQRASDAYLREGPGYAYKILWVYRHKGYPFKESASFDVWRRVSAPDGAVGWMSAQMLSDNRTVLVTGAGRAEIHEFVAPNSKVVGFADPDAVLNLKSCGPEFCRIHAPGVDGWTAKSRIWGVDPGEVFK